MTLQRLLHEGQSSCHDSFLGYEALEDLAFLIDCSPQVDPLATQLHIHLVEAPPPPPEALQLRHALSSDITSEQRIELVPPVPYYLVANVDPALE